MVSVARLGSRSQKVVGSNTGVARSDGICKYLSCLSLIPCSLFRFVLIKLRHCGHLALSSCLMLHAKHYMLCLVVLKACVPKLCVLLYSAVLHGSLFAVCVTVTSCICQLDFNKGYYYYYYYYYYAISI